MINNFVEDNKVQDIAKGGYKTKTFFKEIIYPIYPSFRYIGGIFILQNEKSIFEIECT